MLRVLCKAWDRGGLATSSHSGWCGAAVTAALVGLISATHVSASAWNEPAGHGLFIADYTFTGGSHYFNGTGTLSPAAAYAKSEGIGYIEYGLTDRLMAIVQPELQRITVAPSSGAAGERVARYAGLGTSEAALQIQALTFGPAVLALQTGFRLPGSTGETNPALVGNTSRDLDLRILGGYSVSIAGWPAFVDARRPFDCVRTARPPSGMPK